MTRAEVPSTTRISFAGFFLPLVCLSAPALADPDPYHFTSNDSTCCMELFPYTNDCDNARKFQVPGHSITNVRIYIDWGGLTGSHIQPISECVDAVTVVLSTTPSGAYARQVMFLLGGDYTDTEPPTCHFLANSSWKTDVIIVFVTDDYTLSSHPLHFLHLGEYLDEETAAVCLPLNANNSLRVDGFVVYVNLHDHCLENGCFDGPSVLPCGEGELTELYPLLLHEFCHGLGLIHIADELADIMYVVHNPDCDYEGSNLGTFTSWGLNTCLNKWTTTDDGVVLLARPNGSYCSLYALVSPEYHGLGVAPSLGMCVMPSG